MRMRADHHADWRDASLWPTTQPVEERIRHTAGKQEDPTEKRGIIGAFCRAHTITDVLDITNPGGVASEPVITVYGYGEITLMVGMTITGLEIADKITLDTPLMEAYVGATSMNSCMSGDFPLLLPGKNAVSWSGNVSKVEIQPNWRSL